MAEQTPKRRKLDIENEKAVDQALHLERQPNRRSPRTSLNTNLHTPAKTLLSTITKSTSKMATIGVAIIGAGIFAKEEHLVRHVCRTNKLSID